MDVRLSRHYVPTSMEWLLILSALLNAATGAFTGTRASDPAAQEVAIEAVAMAESVASQAVMVSVAAPTAPAPTGSTLDFQPALDLVVVPAAPETDRLIE